MLDKYANYVKAKINKEDLVADLEFSRVLCVDDGNYSFAYDHYYHYFLALYFRNNIDGAEGPALRNILSSLAASLPSDLSSRFLMFFIYLTRGKDPLIDDLIRNANVVLASQPMAAFAADVEFYNVVAPRSLPELSETVDLEESRKQRRRAADSAPKDELSIPETIVYSDELSPDLKFRFAIAYTEVLGQVLRNFTGSLPGHRKVEILATTYTLGLRLLDAALHAFATLVNFLRQQAAREAQTKQDAPSARDWAKVLEELSVLVGFGLIKLISQSVGSSEIDESAYREAMAEVGINDATELIDLAITLDHSGGEYPFEKFKALP